MTERLRAKPSALALPLCALATLLACGGGGHSHRHADPVVTPRPEVVGKAPRMVTEPRAATLISGGKMFFATLGVRKGAEIKEPENLTSPISLVTEEAGGGGKLMSKRGALLPTFGYQAPDTPGTYHLVAAFGADPALKARVELKVEQAPPGLKATLMQRSVTVTAGKKVAFSARLAAGTPPVQLKVEEPNGGTIEANDERFPDQHIYKAPATPGTYHVLLTSAADPAVSDRAEVRVVADDY